MQQRTILPILYGIVLLGFSGLGTSNAAEAPRRLQAKIDDSRTFQLKGNTRPAVVEGNLQDQGEVSSSQEMPRMSLHFAPTAAQQADLNQFLIAVQDRHSATYHKFLTPEQYATRFGVNDADIAKVTTWLESNGFSNVQVARGKTSVSFSGNAGQVANAFHTAVHRYLKNGESHFANARDPQLPSALQGMASGIQGLHDFTPKPHAKVRPHFTSSISGNTFLTPDDWATIYDVKALYGAGWDGSPLSTAGTACGGSPCSIVVVGQSDVQAIDIAAFRSAAGLSAKTITTLLVPGNRDPGVLSTSGDEGESDLDLEWSNGIAKNANVLFVVAPNLDTALSYAINQNLAPILSTSYGYCEAQEPSAYLTSQNSLFQQANAQGMTIVSASGDGGAADCDSTYPAKLGLSADFPSSSPYVTSVGGTTLTVANTTASGYWSATNNSGNGSALSYIPEVVWNDSIANNALSAGGGGVSIFFAKPSWQVGTGVPADGFRDVPDISLAASPDQNGLLICGDGWCTNGFRNASSSLDVIGGTSAGAPSFAGVLALLVQKTGSPLGNINGNLYALASAAPNSFHDITSGNNIVACNVGTPNCTSGTMGYSAGTGYDLASGWGSIDAYNMVEQWAADIQIAVNPTSATIAAGSSTTAAVTVAPLRGFTGAITFSCSVSSALVGVTCSLPSTTVTTSGSTTVTITASGTAAAPVFRRFHLPPPAMPGVFAVMALLLVALVYAFRKQRVTYAWSAAMMFVLALAMVSCGGGSSSGTTTTTGSGTTHTSESGTVYVVATSGLVKNQALIAVTVP